MVGYLANCREVVFDEKNLFAGVAKLAEQIQDFRNHLGVNARDRLNRSELKRINGKSGSPAAASQPDSQDFEQQLMALARLKESGILTEAEFNQKKKEILGL